MYIHKYIFPLDAGRVLPCQVLGRPQHQHLGGQRRLLRGHLHVSLLLSYIPRQISIIDHLPVASLSVIPTVTLKAKIYSFILIVNIVFIIIYALIIILYTLNLLISLILLFSFLLLLL